MWTFIPWSTLRESRKLQNRQGQSILVQTKNVLLTMITSWEQIECNDIMRVHFSSIRLGTFTVYKTHIILSTAMPQLWNNRNWILSFISWLSQHISMMRGLYFKTPLCLPSIGLTHPLMLDHANTYEVCYTHKTQMSVECKCAVC